MYITYPVLNTLATMARLYIRGYKEEEERKLLGYLECTNFTSYTDFYDVKDFNKIEVRFEVNDEPEAYDTDDEDNPIKQALNRYRQGIKAGVYTSLWKHGKMKTCKYLDCANFTPNSAFYDVTGFDRIRVRFCREDDVKLKGYKKGIKAGVYACLYKDGKFKGCRSIDCANLTSHRDVWDVRDCDKIYVSFLIDPLTYEREEETKTMEDPSTAMDLEPTRIPRRKEPINSLTGIFLKSVYFIDCDLSKCVIVGFVKNRGDSLGILFKGKRNKTKFYIKSDTEEEDIKVTNVFGRMHVFLFDGEHTLTLNKHEWDQFTANIPLMHIVLRDLFLIEEPVKTAIENSDSCLSKLNFSNGGQMEAIIEFHAFKDNDNRFIVKEFVIISHLFRAHIVFKPPYDKAELNSKMARTVRWLERHFHNIKWEEGGIEYDEELIRALCKPFATVYTKGLEKVNFLSSFHNNVVDRNVVESQEAIVSDSHCILPQHNSGFTYACALKKALERGGAGLNSVSPGAFNCSYGRPKLRKTGSSCVCMYVCDRYLYGRPKLRKSRGMYLALDAGFGIELRSPVIGEVQKNMLGGSKFVMEWLPPAYWGCSQLTKRTRLRPDLMGGVERRGRVCILHFPIMFDCERLTSVTIVCFLMATAMFVVMLGVLCCAPRARIGNTTVLLVILALLSVASAGSEDEQPQPSPSTGSWTGDDDGAIDLAQPSTSRGGWSASGWSRRGQEIQNPARPRSDPIPIPTTMFAESDLVEALDRAESQEHDREISELLDRLNEPQEVWDETSLDRRISSLQPVLLSQSHSAAVQRTAVWGWSLPADSDDDSYDASQRRRSMEVAHPSVAPSPTPPTRPPSPVPPHDRLSGLSPAGGSSTESASTFLLSQGSIPSTPPSPELPQIRPSPRVSDWESRECIAALDGIRHLMRELQWTAGRFMQDTERELQARFAPQIWRTIREDLEEFLRTVGERMEDARRNNTTPPPPDAEEAPLSQPRRVECPICMVNLPTVALRLCGHTLCRTCADRVHICPTCRPLILGRFNIYLPR
ncbi:hypothetical protein J6590_076293 [Homalodisca vitripennis]|nr:hypothetical protein J6590_076293 [Homalodisca vitripennis]